MNIGQVLETHLGWAAKGLGTEDRRDARRRQRGRRSCASFLDKIYNQTGGQKEDIASLTDAEIAELAQNLTDGVPMATPVFDGANEDEIKQLLKLADLPETGQTMLYDGRTGERSIGRSPSATCTC